MEQRCHHREIAWYYGGKVHRYREEGYVPYGWQGKEEKASVAALPQSHQRLNIMGRISRDNRFYYASTTKSINGDFVFAHLELFSWQVKKTTVLVLYNARIHKTPRIRAQMKIWAQRRLELFFLPPYSPHLNIANTLWRMLKGRWITPNDYLSADALFYATIQCLDSVRNSRSIKFTSFTADKFF